MKNSEINKESLKTKGRYLNNLFNFYLVFYFILAACYGTNIIFKFIHSEYIFTFILIIMWIVMKPIILFLIIQIKNLMNQRWWLLGSMVLLLPFGEILAANIVIRNVVELLTNEEYP